MSSVRRAVGRGGCLGNGDPLFSADCSKATDIGDKMNLSSASYIARCVKPSHSRESSNDLVPDSHVTRNGGYYQSNRNRSLEIMSEYMASKYSDAGDTFASRPSNAGHEDHHDAVSSGPHVGNAQCGHKDVASRDFILKRFLPAAQAMTADDRRSSAPTSSLPSERRPASLPNGSSSFRNSSRPGSFESGSSRSKSRYFHEVKQDVCGVSEDEDEERLGACGFPLHLGRLTLLQFRYSFWTSRSSSRTKLAPQTSKQVSKKVVQDEASDNSDDLFWSDEEGFDDAMSHSNASVASMNGRESMTSSEMRKGLVAEMLAPPARSMHSMETVHTPDHRGFLGVPKTSSLSSGEMERARQVDRLGARLTRMLSKTNYVESQNARVHDQDEFEAGDSRQGPSATTASTSAEAQKTKWVDARASLRPPPSPKMPSESWLSNTLPPERLLLVKKLSRKPLGSFIPINPPLKPTSEQANCEEEITRPNLRQSSSLKQHLHGRQNRSPTMQAI